MEKEEIKRYIVKKLHQRCTSHSQRLDDGKLIRAMVWPSHENLSRDDIMALLVEAWEVRSAGRFLQRFQEFAESHKELV